MLLDLLENPAHPELPVVTPRPPRPLHIGLLGLGTVQGVIVNCEDIAAVESVDLQYAALMGYRIKRLAPTEHARYYLRMASDASAQTERTVLRALARAGLRARIHGRYTQADRSVHQVVLTQPVAQHQVQQALERLAQLPGMGQTLALRVEQLD